MVQLDISKNSKSIIFMIKKKWNLAFLGIKNSGTPCSSLLDQLWSSLAIFNKYIDNHARAAAKTRQLFPGIQENCYVFYTFPENFHIILTSDTINIKR